jgi:uncharacterized membrane protein YbhN (UPF0104 family)
MIGGFFASFLPSSVGMDAVRAWYLGFEEADNKARGFFSILCDRVTGLLCLLVCGAISSLLLYPTLKEASLFGHFFWSLWTLILVTILSSLILRRFLLETRFGKVFAYLFTPVLFGKSLFLSFLGLSSYIFFCILVGQGLGIQMPMRAYFMIVPLGLVASALPFLPLGIGVGQVAFYHLFLWCNYPDPSQGSTLCTAIQCYGILFNCLGIFFYFRFKSKQELNPKLGEVHIPPAA